MSEKWSKCLPYLFMLLAALSRWPGLFPSNFSAFYGLAFCAGAFFPRSIKWWLPLGTLVLSDIVLNLCFYHVSALNLTQLVNYGAFIAIIGIGCGFSRRSSFLRLLSGGILGAILFYLVTNTASWLTNPDYSKDLGGWLVALTKGTNGFPTTIEFFRNTLMSGGLFTGLFAGAMKLSEAPEPAQEEEPEEEPAKNPEAEPEPDPGKA